MLETSQLFRDFIQLPVLTLTCTVELMTGWLRADPRCLSASPPGPASPRPPGLPESGAPPPAGCAQRRPSGHDLGGDDLKYVLYSFLFTKRNYEVVLMQETGDLVNYATTPTQWGVLKGARFLEMVARGEVARPPLWVELEYPPGVPADDLYHWRIPLEDQRYITMVYRVEARLPKQAGEYAKLQTRALQEIAARMG